MMECSVAESSSFVPPPAESAAWNVWADEGLQGYLRGINRYELLTREEAEELANRFRRHGDQTAGRRLVTANLRLVVKIAQDYKKYWMNNFLDLIQEGNVGLVLAVRKFDPGRGVKFSYYAAYWIRAYIMKYIMDNWRLVKLGTTQVQRRLFYTLNKEKAFLEKQGIEPDAEMLAARLDVRQDEIEEMDLRCNGPEISLDAPLVADSDVERRDMLPDSGPTVEEITADREIAARVRSVIGRSRERFDEREQVILSDRFIHYKSRTLQSIAEQFQVSRERIRQIEAGLIRKVRQALEDDMPDYVHG